MSTAAPAAPAAAPAGSGRPSRTPGVVFVALAVVLVALVAAAFTPAQPPPPPTAEFAPEAAKAIKAPPPNQTSQVGKAGTTGDRGGSQGLKKLLTRGVPVPPPNLDKSGIPTKSVKACVGDPARQTEDPESPPCRSYFAGNNGGATSPGVTKDTINIVIADSNGDVAAALVNYFNKRFQFWGRQLKVVPGGCGESSPAGLKSQADTIAQKGNVFAVIGCADSKGAEYPFYDELARKGIISVANRPDMETEAHMAGFHPYEWTFWPTYDKAEQFLGEIGCRLNGGKATHAGPAYINSPRKFGLITNTFSDQPPPDLTPIHNALAACGIQYESGTVALEHSSASQGYSQNTEQQAATVLSKFKNDGVTTVIDLVHAVTMEQITQVASSINYEPEHIISSYLYLDSEFGLSGLPTDQTSHLFGESTWNPHIAPQQEYWYQAVLEGNPQFKWTDPASYKVDTTYYYNAWYTYYSLLVLSSGIQMAGAHLTPSTFAHGLQDTVFPNPDVPGHPEGKVTVQPGQHSFISDQSLLWFEPGVADNNYSATGSFCYASFGKRWQLGDLPKTLPLYDDATCRRHGS